MAMQGLFRLAVVTTLVMCLSVNQGYGAPSELQSELGTAASTSDVSSREGVATVAAAQAVRSRRSTPAEGEESSDYNADEPGDYEEGEGEGDVEDEASAGPPPKFMSTPLSLSLRPGDNVTLPCLIEGSTKLPRIWLNGTQTLSVNKQTLGNDRIQVLANMSLFIMNVKPEDTGSYTCQISSSPVANLTHKIRVPVPAKIVQHSPKTSVTQGTPLTLTCSVEGIPKPTVKWTLQGNDIPDAEVSEDGTTMTVKSVNKHHAGIYKCEADNGIGQAVSVSIIVQVNTKPQVTVIRDVIKTGEGETVELACNVTGQPKPQVKWYKEREELEIGSSRYEVTAQGFTYILRIKNFEKSDFGIYSCSAKSKYGSRQKNITVSGTPDTPMYVGHEIENDKIILSWTVESASPIHSHELLYRKAGMDEWIRLKPEVKDGKANSYHVDVEMPALPSGQYEAYLRSENEYGWTDSHYVTFEGLGKKVEEENSDGKPAAETSKRGPDNGSSASVVGSMTVVSSALLTTLVFTLWPISCSFI